MLRCLTCPIGLHCFCCIVPLTNKYDEDDDADDDDDDDDIVSRGIDVYGRTTAGWPDYRRT